MKGLQQLPRYRDPIISNVARLLLRSLQEQHRAPSNTVIEMEGRLGQQVAQANMRRHEFPLATVTPTVLDTIHHGLFAFESGVTFTIMRGLELALIEKKFARSIDFSPSYPRYASEDVVFNLSSDRRLMASIGTLMEMLHRSQRNASAAKSGSSSDDGLHHTSSDSSPASSLCAAQPLKLKNPFSLLFGVAVTGALTKQTIARMDLCCPGWSADLRFSVAAETTSPPEPGEVLTVPQFSRYRNRTSFPISPLFTLSLTRTITRYDTWWHPGHNIAAFCDPIRDAPHIGLGTILPSPPLFRDADGLVPAQRRRSGSAAGSINFRSKDRASASGAANYEVEVEVNVPALLQAWKRHYGGAAAATYLSSAELLHTTTAGTVFGRSGSFTESPLEDQQSADQLSAQDVRAFALAEREDPFLLRIAEDYMTVMQFVGQLRTYG